MRIYIQTIMILLAMILTQTTLAKELKLPDGKLKKPIELCQKSPDPELSGETVSVLQQSIKSVKCGKYQQALEQAYYAIELIQELQQVQTQLGYCYYKFNCAGKVVSGQKVTKKHCKHLAGGKSWRQTNPAPAACVNI